MIEYDLDVTSPSIIRSSSLNTKKYGLTPCKQNDQTVTTASGTVLPRSGWKSWQHFEEKTEGFHSVETNGQTLTTPSGTFLPSSGWKFW
jgi:hypothetical protein